MIADLTNCTIADNGGDGLHLTGSETTGSSATLLNTIFSGNGGDGVEVIDISASGPTIIETYNDFYGNTGNDLVRTGTGGTTYPTLDASDLTVDPLYAGTGDEPYQLTALSTLLDAGGAGYPADDILGVSRPQGTGPSMGAYEAAVPEPATMGLLGLGFAGMAALRRRRRNVS